MHPRKASPEAEEQNLRGDTVYALHCLISYNQNLHTLGDWTGAKALSYRAAKLQPRALPDQAPHSDSSRVLDAHPGSITLLIVNAGLQPPFALSYKMSRQMWPLE